MWQTNDRGNVSIEILRLQEVRENGETMTEEQRGTQNILIEAAENLDSELRALWDIVIDLRKRLVVIVQYWPLPKGKPMTYTERMDLLVSDLELAPPKNEPGYETVYYYSCKLCGEEVLPEDLERHTEEHKNPQDFLTKLGSIYVKKEVP